MSTTCLERSRGFGVIAAIVILVILSGLAAFVVSLSTTQNITFAQDIQGARAFQAARAGTEWGAANWLNSNSCSNAGAPATIDGFTLTISATPTPNTVATNDAEFCVITSTATTGGSPGAIGYVERRLTVVVESNS